MKKSKKKPFSEYVYIRLDDSIKKRVKEKAALDGSNMTIWIRQLIMRELNHNKGAYHD